MTINTGNTEADVSEGRTIVEVHCYACGHNWIPRTAKIPTACPRCKRFKWRKEDWEASKLKRKGGRKHVASSARPKRRKNSITNIGPQTEKFIRLHSPQSSQNS